MDSTATNNGHLYEEHDANHTVSTSPATTTISTIVLQSQPIQIVVGLLQSRNTIHIKIVEISPKLDFIGANIEETVQLQRDHEKIHKKLQEQNTPIDEFFAKAEQLLIERRIDPQLLDAMGQSLSIAWEDLLLIFQQRRSVLDSNANFHEKIGACLGKMSALEVACRDTMLPKEIDLIQEFLSKFKQLRIEVLASVMVSLKEGNELLAKLRETAMCGQLESRPDSIKVEIKKSITQVELWLEELHDRRNVLEHAWQTRKIQLEQCLALAILTRDINELENALRVGKQTLDDSIHELDTELDVNRSLDELEGFKADAVAIRDRALKITRSTEKLASLGCFAGDDASTRAYVFLNECTEYLEFIENREHLLSKMKEFFGKAQKTLLALKRLESEAVNIPQDLYGMKQAISRIISNIATLTEEPLRLGYNLLDRIGRSNIEAFGVEKTVAEIENRKVYLEELYTQNNNQYLKITESLNEFFENCRDISAWLVSVNKAFLNSNNSMGSTLDEGKTFLKLHHQLLSDLEIKGTEINHLFTNTSKILESLDEAERKEVHDKVQSLHDTWDRLKTIVENRVDLATNFIKFLLLAEKLATMFQNVEEVLRSAPEESKLSQLDDVWIRIKSAYAQLKDDGTSFLEHTSMVVDTSLETKLACLRVKEILADFSSRQFNITESWENWTSVIVEKRETDLLLEEIMSKNELTLISASKLDAQLYPILTKQTSDLNALNVFLNDKLKNVLADIEKAQIELAHHIRTTAALKPKDGKTADKVAQVLRNLNAIVDKLTLIQNEFRSLVESIIAFVQQLIQTKTSIEQYFERLTAPNLENIDELFRENNQFTDGIMKRFQQLFDQSEKLIDQIRKQEPIEIKENDIKYIMTLLDTLRITFESQNNLHAVNLKQEVDIYRFKKDLNDIFQNIDHLKNQLNDTNGQFKENAASAKTTALGFDYFEQTIQLLDQRIDIFINTSENICNSNHEIKPFIQNSISELKKYWNDFKRQVNNTRHSIQDTKTYFNINDQIDSEYRDHKAYLQTITSQIPFVKHPNEASQLINKIDLFISDNEAKQLDQLKQLAILSKSVYGFDKTIEKYSDNIELFQSYFSTKSQLNNLIEQLYDEAETEALTEQKELEQLQRQQQLNENDLQKEQYEIHTESQQVIVEESPQFVHQLCDATVQEGDKYKFECQVIGSPMPTIEWFKDGISIKSYPDYLSKYENGHCVLSIEETFTEDSACFMCQAINPLGTAETTARLFVKETEAKNILLPPNFIKPLQNCAASSGASLLLECTVEGNPLPTVQWFKDDICIDNVPSYGITYNNGEAILRLDDLTKNDQAIYTCKATNVLGLDQCAASIEVNDVNHLQKPNESVIVKNQRPEFTVPLSNVMARVGQTIKLECKLIGDPKPELSWKLNGKMFQQTNAKLQYDNERVTLLIPEAFPKDAGLYVLCAKNLAGLAYTSCNVCVKGRQPNDLSDTEMAVNSEPVKPTVQLPLRDISALEAQCVQLDCVITGNPEPEVIWYHEGRPVKESADVQLIFQGDRCSMLIQEAYLDDNGEYKVVAINSAGETSSQCVLTVIPLNESEPVKRNAIDIKVNGVSDGALPRFEKLLCDILGNEGETITFECEVIGVPTPTVKWYLNNNEIFENDRIQFVHNNNDGKVKLILSNVTNEDKGVYTVKATNPSGEAKCFSHLIVKSVNAPENLLLQTQISDVDDKHICPTFKEKFSDKIANIDETVKFECIIVGKPTPKIKWFYNGKPVQGKNFLTSTSGERQVLTIPSVTHEAVGQISCTAENDFGRATCIAYLNLLGDLAPPSSEQCQRYVEEYNTESSNVTLKKQLLTTTRTSQISSYQSENGVPIVDSNIINTAQHFEQRIPEHFGSTQLCEINKSTSTKLVSDQHDILHKSTRKTTAPRFISPLIGKILDQGANTVLEAIVDGFPLPEIVLSRNGEPLLEKENISISRQFNKIIIELRQVTVADAGRYSCSATNNMGNAVSTADVVVKKSVFPPVFGHRLQAQVIKRGERIVMDVEVSGTPDPEVTWFKNNKQLEPNSSEYRIKKSGNNYTLFIEKANIQDAGKYMVRAINAGGETQSIADVIVLEPTPERMIEIVKTVKVENVDGQKIGGSNTSATVPSSYQSSHIENTTQSDSHGTSEQTILTETRCVTETTLRMEHKSPHPDIEPPTFISKSPIPINQFSNEQKYTEKLVTQSKSPIEYLPNRNATPHQDEVDYATNKLNTNSCETIKYSTFKSSGAVDKLSTDPNKLMYSNAPLPIESKLYDDLNDLNLIPGPAPEIGYMPKVNDIRASSTISDRIKQLESSQAEEHEPPSGGIRIFPNINLIEKHEEYSQTFSKTLNDVPIQSQPIEPIYRPASNISIRDNDFRSPSPRPSAEGVNMEKLWASPKPFEHARSPIFDVQETNETLRRSSIRETTRAIENKIKEYKSVPQNDFQLKAPSLVKYLTPIAKPQETFFKKTAEVPVSNIILEPGSPPEMCFAPRTEFETRPSVVETVERSLEHDLQRGPTKVLPFSVRTMPPSPKNTHIQKFDVNRFKVNKPCESSGYAADTEDSRYSCMKTEHFESHSNKQYYEKSNNYPSTPTPTIKPFSPYDHELERNLTDNRFSEKYHSPVASNISINTKQIKIKDEPIIQRIPSPLMKLKRNDIRESDYESDYDALQYKPIKPIQTPTGRISNVSSVKSPVTPSEFDRLPKFDGTVRPKFQPIDKYNTTNRYHQSSKTTRDYVVVKPKPVSAKPYEPKPIHLKTTQYYTATAGPPYHNQNPVATETVNRMQMQEHTESCHRVVNMSSTKRIIQLDEKIQQQNTFGEQLEPFPFRASPSSYAPRQRLPPPATPTKFIPVEFRESDYDSEIEAVKIRPIWTPNPSDSDEPHYRRVLAPTPSRSISVPRNYGCNERILTPMEFDRAPPEMPSKIYRTPSSSPQFYNTSTRDSFKTQTLDRYLTKKKNNAAYRTPQDDIEVNRGAPPKYGFISKDHEYSSRNEQKRNTNYSSKQSEYHVRQSVTEPIRPILKRTQSATDSSQIYRNESKVSQYGTKHIDPDSGLIYFKYDFGYEFGIIFPGEGRKFIAGGNNVNSNAQLSKNKFLHNSAGVIDIPVLHENTIKQNLSNRNSIDFLQLHKKIAPNKLFRQPAIAINVDEFHNEQYNQNQQPLVRKENNSNNNLETGIIVNSSTNSQEHLPKRPPLFITPLKDIAVVKGQTARFECIVQCDPHPYVGWYRNDNPLRNGDGKYLVEFRNGVCRLTIPDAHTHDAGIYTCTGTNHLGSVVTSAELIVPGENWGVRMGN